MHPRNPYCEPPDFISLADAYEALRPHLISESRSHRKTIDFKDAEGQRRLTEAIMFRDFGVKLHIPSNRLCPPVPNRMNFVLWIQDIVHAHREVLERRPRSIRGIDIGTGATAIYPFLACKLEQDWQFVATELDDESFESARANVSTNGMDSRIDVRKASAKGDIFFPLEENVQTFFEFSMCNPPFYGSAQEVTESAQAKELPPSAVCTGTDIEMIYPDGGEAGFVSRMVDESERFQTRCKWYTSMLGKMFSVVSIVEVLRQRSITNYAITEFVQGQTRRWAIGWSFTDLHLPDSIARIPFITPTHIQYPVLPPRNTLVQTFPDCTFKTVRDALSEILQSIEGVSATEVNHPHEPSDSAIVFSHSARDPTNSGSADLFFIEAQENTWSRSARRKRQHRPQPQEDIIAASRDPSLSLPSTPAPSDFPSSPNPALTCSARIAIMSNQIDIAPDAGTAATTGICAVEFQWIFGKDRALFESFVSHVNKKVGIALQSRLTSRGA
ncbi:hypothetical protein BDZ97DRAFT_67956 [Flammula alnicola]|nr:hypothetical protein BDZ97DRAFT_67956 [Flammula alnicola]